MSQSTSRNGTPSQIPFPSGQPMLRQVISLGKRTTCLSANFIKSLKVNAVLSFFVNELRSRVLFSGSASTSSFQVSRVRPTFLRCDSSRVCGIGSPRETSPKSSCLVSQVSRFANDSCNIGFCPSTRANKGKAQIPAAPDMP